MSFEILGLGTANPPASVTADDGLAIARLLAAEDVRTSTWLGPIYANVGVRRRFQVIGFLAMKDALNGTNETGSPFLPTRENEGVGPTTTERMQAYAREAGPLAMRASVSALAESGLSATTITHLITVSCTGFAAPGVDRDLITTLKLNPGIQRTHIGFMGCHGALNGLRVANAFTTADPTARVLVCAVELCSLHYYYGNAPDKLVANAIFADGAATLIGASRERTSCSRRAGDVSPPVELNTGGLTSPAHQTLPSLAPGSPQSWSLIASGSYLVPDSAPDMGWSVGNHGFEMSLSRRVPGLIAKHLRPWLVTWLRDNGLSLAEVRSWAIHPGGPKIISAVEESLALPSVALEPSREIFANYGNMSSPTVLFVLNRLRQQNAPTPCVALGFGPGLVAEAALFG
jgi:predicted naringenin-chalcone synthase